MIADKQRQMRVGFVGAGYIAQWHAQAVHSVPGVELVAIADVDIAKANQLAEEFQIDSAYSSVDDLIAQSNVDAIHILVPPDYHHDVTMKCIEKGLHVFLEKPMAVSADQCKAIADRAREKDVKVLVNHNFLFSRPFLKLRQAISDGEIGKITAMDVAWNKPLPQLVHGPFNIWMLREPQNLLLELGPHLLSPVVELLGQVDQINALVTHPTTIPGGKSIYRNWAFSLQCGAAAVQARMSLGLGISEFTLHVRGTHGAATCDFENETFLLDRATPYSMDFDRYHRLRSGGKSLRKQAVAGIGRYIGGKLGVVNGGNPYGDGIRHSVSAFYQSLTGNGTSAAHQESQRECDLVSAEQGHKVIELCERVFAAVDLESNDTSLHGDNAATANVSETEDHSHSMPTPNYHTDSGDEPKYLVLGGTGFIGRALIRRLVEKGMPVRAVVRRPGDVPDELRHDGVELFKGDMLCEQSICDALEGTRGVFHLARGNGKTWSDYTNDDIAPSLRIAQLCHDLSGGRLVYTSSIDSYYAGRNAGVITEQTPLDARIRRRNLYAQSKSVIEDKLFTMHDESGLDVVIARPGIVIGRGGSPFHWGIGMWNSDSVCQVWGDGNNKLPLVLVDDVADGLIAAMKATDVGGRSFNFVAEPTLSAREYLAELSRVLGAKIDVRPTPIWSFYAMDLMKWSVKTAIRHPERRLPSYHDWESRTQRANFDCTLTRKQLNWQPSTQREQMIRKGIEEPTLAFVS
tara:strand:- start:89302 stop:91533 length:2232 start_codon:yes stop_codon:yes gene_type:complete